MAENDANPYAGAAYPTPGQPMPLGPEEWQPSHSPTDVTFAHHAVDPPAVGYVQNGDQLVVNASTLPGSGDTVTVFVRLLLPVAPMPGQPDGSGFGNMPLPMPSASAVNAGWGTPVVPALNVVARPATVQALVMQVVVGGASSQTASLALPEGYILSLAVCATSATKRGMVFVRAWVQQRNAGGGGIQPAMMLLADYVTTTAPVGWPMGRVLYPTDGPGGGFPVNIANPAAGADWTFLVQAHQRVRLSSLTATFVASASVATRIPHIQILSSSGTVVWRAAPQATIVASQTVLLSAASTQVQSVIDTGCLNWPLPTPCVLMPGESLQTITAAIQAGDQWSVIWLTTEQWVDAI